MDKETSFQRANRLADEAKAAKRAAYVASPQHWRAFDWSDYDSADCVWRPVETAVFQRLHLLTRRVRPLEGGYLVDIWHEVRHELGLRDLLLLRGETLVFVPLGKHALRAVHQRVVPELKSA